MENFNNNLNNQGGGMNNIPQNRGYQNPTTPPQSYIPSAPTGGYQNPTPNTGGYQNPTPPKKSGNKKPIILVSIIIAVIAVAVVVICVVAFGGDSQPISGSSNTVSTVDNNSVSDNENNENSIVTDEVPEYSKKGTADIKEIVANGITLSGKRISLPCTVKDLGDGWYIDENVAKIKTKSEVAGTNAESLRPTGSLTNGKERVGVVFCEYSDTGYEDITICGLSGYGSTINVYGLSDKNGNIANELKQLFGEPTQTSNSGAENSTVMLYRYYENFNDELLEFNVENDNSIATVRITYLPEEYR